MNAYIYINYNNIVVLKEYLDVVKLSLDNLGYTCKYIKTLQNVKKNDLIVFPMGIDAFKYYMKGYKNFIIWQQGATADESFMRNHSLLRKKILNFIDVFSMKKAKFILYVSKYMEAHYSKIAKTNFDKKSYIMPCFNEELDTKIFDRKDYTKKTFTYVGSLDLWQCFDKIVDIYVEIEKKVPNCFFKVLTFQESEAKKILEEKGAKKFLVKRVPKEQVKEELLDCTYGFIIREDNMVNRVATPTKISLYLSAGVIPIFSQCLIDFYKISKMYDFMICLDDKNEIDKIINKVILEIDSETVQSGITSIFETYYNKSRHVKLLTERLSSCI